MRTPSLQASGPAHTSDKTSYTGECAVLRSEARDYSMSSSSTVEGHVQKRGQLNPVFKERYFVLEGLTLKYFKTKQTYANNHAPQGTLDCRGLVVTSDPLNDTDDMFNFIIETASGTKVPCACNSSKTRHMWLHALGERARLSHASIFEVQSQHHQVRQQTDESPILGHGASSDLEEVDMCGSFGGDADRQMRAALSESQKTTGSPLRENSVFQIRTQVHTFVHIYCIYTRTYNMCKYVLYIPTGGRI